MKTNDFFEAMGKIGADLIERADREVTVKRKRPLLKIAVIAASFAVMVAGLAIALPSLIGGGGHETPGDVIVWENVFGLFSPSKGSGLKIQEEMGLAEYSFSEILTAKYEKYEIGNAFPLDKNGEFIGEKIDDIEARNGWRWNIDGKERDVVIVGAEVYEIKGVSIDAAVAVKYLEKGGSQTTEHYYAAVNTEYNCESLSGFFDDLNAAVHMEIAKEVLACDYAFGTHRNGVEKYRMNDGIPADISKLVLGLDAEAEHVGYYEGVDARIRDCENMLRFTFSMDSAGRTVNFLYVLDNGYVAIQGIGEGYVLFNVGTENTDGIFDMLEGGSELVTVIPADPDGDGLVEATTSAPVNEAVPE